MAWRPAGQSFAGAAAVLAALIGAAIVAASLTLTSDLTVQGNTTLGNGSGVDSVTVNGTVGLTSSKAGSPGINVTQTTEASTQSYMPAINATTNGTYDTTAGGINAVAVYGICNVSKSAGANPLFCSAVYGQVNGGGAPDNRAVRGVAAATTANTTNYAGVFTNTSSGASTVNYGVYGDSGGAGTINYGGYFSASGASSSNYAIYTDNGDVVLNATSGVTRTGNLNGYTRARQLADQDVTNAGLTDSNTLTIATTAGKIYAINAFIIAGGNNTTGDYIFDFAVTGGTMDCTGTEQSVTTADAIQDTTVIATAAADTADTSVGTRADASLPIAIRISIACKVSNTTTLKYRFGNAAAAAGRTSRTMAGSYIDWAVLN